MSNNIPLFVIGLPKTEFANGLLMSKFGHTLEKAKKILPEIIEAKIVVILGSVRSEKNGIKVAKWVVGKLKEKGQSFTSRSCRIRPTIIRQNVQRDEIPF